MQKRINDTELRKKQILEKASALFLEKGYAGVGIDEIAEACGVVRGTILRYFHSKKSSMTRYFSEEEITPEPFWESTVMIQAFRHLSLSENW